MRRSQKANNMNLENLHKATILLCKGDFASPIAILYKAVPAAVEGLMTPGDIGGGEGLSQEEKAWLHV